MHRRSAVTRLAATLAGLSLGEVPSLDAEESPSGEPFAVTRANLADSSGTVTCPICHEMSDSLALTPAGLCLRCADENPTMKAPSHSDPFWTLSPRELRRLEIEIRHLSAKLERMDDRFGQLEQGSDAYNRAMEAGRDEWHAMQRELHLLQLLRGASKQFWK